MADHGVAGPQIPRRSSASIGASGSFFAATRTPAVMRGGSHGRSPGHAVNGGEPRGTAPERTLPRAVGRSARSRSSGPRAQAATRERDAASRSAAAARWGSRSTRRLVSRPLRRSGRRLSGRRPLLPGRSARMSWNDETLRRARAMSPRQEGRVCGPAGLRVDRGPRSAYEARRGDIPVRDAVAGDPLRSRTPSSLLKTYQFGTRAGCSSGRSTVRSLPSSSAVIPGTARGRASGTSVARAVTAPLASIRTTIASWLSAHLQLSLAVNSTRAERGGASVTTCNRNRRPRASTPAATRSSSGLDTAPSAAQPTTSPVRSRSARTVPRTWSSSRPVPLVPHPTSSVAARANGAWIRRACARAIRVGGSDARPPGRRRPPTRYAARCATPTPTPTAARSPTTRRRAGRRAAGGRPESERRRATKPIAPPISGSQKRITR